MCVIFTENILFEMDDSPYELDSLEEVIQWLYIDTDVPVHPFGAEYAQPHDDYAYQSRGSGVIRFNVSDEGKVGVSRNKETTLRGANNPETIVAELIPRLFISFDGPPIPLDKVEEYSLEDFIYLGINPDGSVFSDHFLTDDVEIQGYKYVSVCVEIEIEMCRGMSELLSYTKVMKIPWAYEPEE